MYSKAAIVNMALSRIGVTTWLDNIEGPEFEAQAANRIWDHCLRDTLSAFRWPFATKRTQPSLIDTGDEYRAYSNTYALPDDYITACDVITLGQQNPRIGSKIEFHVEHWEGRSVLVSDYTGLELIYVGMVDDPNLYSPSFVETLAWRLAQDLALSLAQSPKLSQQAEQRYFMSIDRARATTAGEGHAPQPQMPEWITDR